MDIMDMATVFRYHQERTLRFGKGDAGALGWEHPEIQQHCYTVLTSMADMNNCSVLDAGCGYGDMRKYLAAHFNAVRYFGIDIMPAILNIAIEDYKYEPETLFFEGDFSVAELPCTDYILACRSLCYANSDALYLFKTIEKLYRSCRKGLGFTLLKNVNTTEKLLEQHQPASIMDFCNRLSEKVTLKEISAHDYYCIFMYH